MPPFVEDLHQSSVAEWGTSESSEPKTSRNLCTSFALCASEQFHNRENYQANKSDENLKPFTPCDTHKHSNPVGTPELPTGMGVK